MKEFFMLFWSSKSVFERTVRSVLVMSGTGLVAWNDSPWWAQIVGAALNGAGLLVAAGEKNGQ